MIRKFFWCLFHPVRVYEKNDDLTALIRKCIWLIENCPDVTVDIDYYDIRIKTPKLNIKLWNANKFNGWLCTGKINGREFHDIMPSLGVSYDFKECLKKHGYNIYQKRKEQTIDITDIKC